MHDTAVDGGILLLYPPAKRPARGPGGFVGPVVQRHEQAMRTSSLAVYHRPKPNAARSPRRIRLPPRRRPRKGTAGSAGKLCLHSRRSRAVWETPLPAMTRRRGFMTLLRMQHAPPTKPWPRWRRRPLPVLIRHAAAVPDPPTAPGPQEREDPEDGLTA